MRHLEPFGGNRREKRTFEAIRAEEATNPLGAISTLLPEGVDPDDWWGGTPPVGRRHICYMTQYDMDNPDYADGVRRVYDQLIRLGFGRVDIRGEDSPFVLHHPSPRGRAMAMELKEIAERHGGYLSHKATREEARRIGELLEYDRADIEGHLASKHPLNEGQTFPFEDAKKSIIKWANSLAGTGETWYGFSPTYNLIRGGRAKVGDALGLGFTKEQADKWYRFFSGPPFKSTGNWSQLDLNPNMPRRTGPDRTLNHYVTVDQTRDNIMAFSRSLNTLVRKLQSVSQKHRTPVSFKTITILDGFVRDNDSLKVFFYDPAAADDIEAAVEEWARESGVRISDRTHKRGVDMRPAPGADKSSWGQILADRFDEEFVRTVKMHGGKYTGEQYYQWYKKNLPDFLARSGYKNTAKA